MGAEEEAAHGAAAHEGAAAALAAGVPAGDFKLLPIRIIDLNRGKYL